MRVFRFVRKRVLCYNKIMKILYVSSSTETGGAETALRALALYAQKQGHTVKVISLKPLGAVGADMRQAGLDVISLHLVGKIRPLETAGVLVRLMQEIESFGPDIVHAMLYRAIQLCRLAKRRLPFTLLTTPHYDLSRKNFFLRLIDRALKEEDNISAAESQATKAYLLQKQKYSDKKVRLVTNGVDRHIFRPNVHLQTKEREKWGFSAQDVVFVCAARLSKEKNHRLLLQSFASVAAKNARVKLLLCGDGPEKEDLAEFVRSHALEKKVFFTGEVSDIYPFLLVSDVAVLVSFVESLPMFLLEACSCGLPAIVSKVGDMPLLIRHGINGFVCNEQDSVLLSALMAEMAENKVLRKKMGEESSARIQRFYPNPAQVYLKIYEEIK